MDVLTEAEAVARFSAVSKVDYVLALRLSADADFSGEVQVSFDYLSPESPAKPSTTFLSSLTSFIRPQPAISTFLDFAGGTLTSYAFQETPPSQQPPQAEYSNGRINLRGLVTGRYKLQLSYRNSPTDKKCGVMRWTDSEDEEVYIYTHFEPFGANHMCPCFDQPDLKCSLTLLVTAPSGWKVIANSPLEDCFPSSGGMTHRFAPTLRFSTYLWAVCAGNFSEWSKPWKHSSLPLRLYCRKSLTPKFPFEEVFSWTIAAFDYLTAYFNQPYEYLKYDQVFVPALDAGAMENVGCVVFNDSYIQANRTMLQEVNFCNTVLHESVHVWLGNTVTMKWWGDVWLNESFATYISAKAQFNAFPALKATLLHAFLTFKELAYDVDEVPKPHPIRKTIETADCKNRAFDMAAYVKGSSVLEQLEFTIGEPAFQSLLQAWILRYRYQNVSFADFQCLLQELQPTLSPDWLQRWVCDAGVNELEAEVSITDKRISSFLIHQRANRYSPAQTLRCHCLQVALIDSSGQEYYTARVALSGVGRQTCEEFVGLPAPCFALINSTEQGHCKVSIPEAAFPLIASLQRSDSRHCALRGMLHAVRDGTLAAPVYIETAAAVIRTEPEVGLCHYLANTVLLVLLACVSPGNYRKRLASSMYQSVLQRVQSERDPAAKAELQSYLFRFLIHPFDIMEAVGWLQRSPPDLSLQVAERVEIIKHYAEISIAAVELAEMEEISHPGTDTECLAIYCRAAAPVPVLKDRTFRIIHEEAELLPRKEWKAFMRGFSQANQSWLLPYALRMLQTFPNLLKPPLRAVAEDYALHMMPLYMDPGLLLKRIKPFVWVIKTVSSKAADRCEEILDRLSVCERCRRLTQEHLLRTAD